MNLHHFLAENMICAHFVGAVTFACSGGGCSSAGVDRVLALEMSHIRSLHIINMYLVIIGYYTHCHHLWYRLLQVTNKGFLELGLWFVIGERPAA